MLEILGNRDETKLSIIENKLDLIIESISELKCCKKSDDFIFGNIESLKTINDEAKKSLEQICDENNIFTNFEENGIKKSDDEEKVDHPKHYNSSGIECIDEMILLFGIKATADFCKLNVFKYRSRALFKGNPEEDMEKSNWYMRKYAELKDLMDMEQEFSVFLKDKKED